MSKSLTKLKKRKKSIEGRKNTKKTLILVSWPLKLIQQVILGEKNAFK